MTQKVRIVTDSTADLDKNILEEYNIEVVPLTYTLNGVSYTDGIDFEPAEFIEKMMESAEIPKSSQPSPIHFKEVYDRLHAEGFQVLSIHMSGKLSGTVRAAQQGASLTGGEVTVIDSNYISSALGFQVIEAAKMAKKGAMLDKIISHIEQVRKNTFLYVSVDTLEHLQKGGRIGKGKALLGSLLNIKPIASLQDGIFTPITKVRSHSQVVKFFMKQLIQDIKDRDLLRIGVAHANALDLALRLKEELLKITTADKIDICTTTPIISIHTGKGALGVSYYVKP
ncbi:DegV family protein [Aeribacillus composti]|uniref:DegV family protein n=1 Tax=Aeribacillus composti TaxID=1868734 RepID=UPI002E218056|nr:DegV family protein [Aeribacillus composti]